MNLVTLAQDNFEKFGEYRYLVSPGREFTNLQLLKFADRFANALKSLGIQPGERVLVMLPNLPEVLISYQGILRAQAVIVPVVAALAENELSHILRNSQAAAVVTSALFLPKVAAVRPEIETLREVIIIEPEPAEGAKNFWPLVQDASSEAATPALAEDDLAVIIYTSGTTGLPKGVMLTHANLYSNAVNSSAARRVKREDVSLAVLPLSHSFGITVMNNSLIYGNLWVLLPRFDVEEVFKAIDAYRVTTFPGVPAMFNMMLLAARELKQKYDLSSLREVTSGSAPLLPETYAAFERVFNVKIRQGYGLSEASPIVSVPYDGREIKPASVGQAIPGTELRIVDELGGEVNPGQVGELIVKGPNVSPGYYNLPRETADTFRDGWLYTGDMARLDDEGYLYLVERKKDLIIRGGFNIYPRDIEEVLVKHPKVKEAAVIGVADPVMGEEVKAFVVPADGAEPTAGEIIEHCQEHLSKNKIPKYIETIKALPRSPLGKVLRKKLREL